MQTKLSKYNMCGRNLKKRQFKGHTRNFHNPSGKALCFIKKKNKQYGILCNIYTVAQEQLPGSNQSPRMLNTQQYIETARDSSDKDVSFP